MRNEGKIAPCPIQGYWPDNTDWSGPYEGPTWKTKSRPPRNKKRPARFLEDDNVTGRKMKRVQQKYVFVWEFWLCYLMISCYQSCLLHVLRHLMTTLS